MPTSTRTHEYPADFRIQAVSSPSPVVSPDALLLTNSAWG